MQHVFELKGLGQAPYTYIRCVDRGHRSHSDCKFCGTGIRYEFWLRSADGKEFFVGSDCIFKSGDVGLTKTVKSVKKDQARQVREAKKQAEFEIRKTQWAEELIQKKQNWLDENPDCVPVLNWARTQSGIPKSMIDNFEQWGNLSVNQIVFLKKLYNEAHSPVVKQPCPEGKVTVEGVIKGYKYSQNAYGSVLKMFVETDEGYRVYGTSPGSLSNAQQGDRIRFVATLTQSKDDPTFGFFTRPTQAQIV